MPDLEHQGCRLHYRLSGAGAPVLLIQGVGVEGNGWLPQIEALAPYYHCLSFDNRGIGRSLPTAGKLSIELFAADALALMDAAGWEKAHVIGHSMGGLIAQHLAIAARHRVRSLSLLCTFARGRDVTALTWPMLVSGLRTRIGPKTWRRKAFLEMVHAPESLAHQMADLFGHDLADQPPIVMKHLNAMSRYDATPRLSELAAIPTLVVSALHDRIAKPALGRAIAAAIPGAKYIEFEDAGHALPITHPARLNTLLLDHLQHCL
ncbi:MAG: alpha/beta fold hydrolase [Acidobacteria bacterium]|nr:alpha/beta fold hydrolase [Acidobacteriota bacterium]